jgi:hypothetical protein
VTGGADHRGIVSAKPQGWNVDGVLGLIEEGFAQPAIG